MNTRNIIAILSSLFILAAVGCSGDEPSDAGAADTSVDAATPPPSDTGVPTDTSPSDTGVPTDTSPPTTCATDEDCVVIYDECCACGAWLTDLIGIRADQAEAYEAALCEGVGGCDACIPALSPADLRAVCSTEGACTFTPTECAAADECAPGDACFDTGRAGSPAKICYGACDTADSCRAGEICDVWRCTAS